MEPTSLQVFLRVLYTINNNLQYILAKSSSPVLAVTCNETTAQSGKNEPMYAKAPLKACLAAVCDSSPELLQDPTRDFSLYVLDPLEARPPPTTLTQASTNPSPPQGVAVALGLMSWALESSESTNVIVTGTIIPNASPALEVVFALRETKRMPKPTIYSYPSFGTINAIDPSQPVHLPHPSQAAWMSWMPTPNLQQDQQERKTLTRSSEFPELYIGPPRRARGRPEGSVSSKPRATSQDGSASNFGTSSTKAVETQSKSKDETKGKSKQKSKPKRSRAQPTRPPFISAPLTRRVPTSASETNSLPAFYQQSHPSSQGQLQPHTQLYPQAQPCAQPTQNPLLELLSAIPSTSSGNTSTTAGQQAALLSVLQGLLANPHLLQLAPPTSSRETTTKEEPVWSDGNMNDDGDSDIVILDSSTVDTAAFRKPSARPLIAKQELPVSSRQGIDLSPLPASTPPSGQESAPISSQTSTPTVSPGTETPTPKSTSAQRTGEENTTLDVVTPTPPSRARKRTRDEYVEGQIDSFLPMFPASPSPSTRHSSGSWRALAARQRIQSSPTSGTKSQAFSSQRLPSMLDSMRAVSSSCSRRQGSQLTTEIPGPSMSKSEHPDASSSAAAVEASPKRRRTLNLTEFMEEHEARRIRKHRKRTSSGRRPFPEAPPNEASPRPSNLSSMMKHAQSSPPRPLFRSNSSLPTPICHTDPAPGLAASNPVSTTTSNSTAPSTSASTVLPAENPLKNFVLPAWARTGTAMLPRLSEEVLARQHAEKEAKKAQVSQRRREAAKAKRKRLQGGEHPSKESSDEGGGAVPEHTQFRPPHPSSSVVRSAPLPTSAAPSLPVFASDAVEPIPSSPPRPHRQAVPPAAPSTPPRKSVSSLRTPSKSGSLSTPSGHDMGSLFTPSTPNAFQSLSRSMFTPRSPTVLRRSSPRKSLRKGMSQVPRTPMGHSHHQTPASSRTGRSGIRTPQTQTRMGTRAFLLPPPSPCAFRMPQPQKQVQSDALAGSTSSLPENSGIAKQGSPSVKRDAEEDKSNAQEDILGCKRDDTRLKGDTPNFCAEQNLGRPIMDGGEESSELRDINNLHQKEEEYVSSPLPPSSPLPASPFSSPAKHRDDDGLDDATANNPIPDSDILLPSASDSDKPTRAANANWLSDDVCSAPWFTDSETSAWFTEADAWLTDTDGGPLLTDSDGAWLSDSDAVFGDMSSLPPSSASNWLSDDADVEANGELGAMEGQVGELDAVALERVFATLVDRSEQDGDEAGSGGTMHGVRIDPEFWESMQQLADLNESRTSGDGGSTADQDLRGLLDDLVDG